MDVRPKTSEPAQNAGELNFQITGLIQQFLDFHGQSYGTFNTVVGALECAKLELYRRLVVPYENAKIQDNGDVYS